jgi:DNA-binding response OmpR family regulator
MRILSSSPGIGAVGHPWLVPTVREVRPRLLLVEDEPGIVDFLVRGLRGNGFSVEAALDGVKGAQLALSGEFDLVILDLMLPGRDGLDVLSEVHLRRPELPVIILTARGEVEDRVGGLDAGAVDYVIKPFSLAELVARIRAQLRTATHHPVTELEGGGLQVDLISRDVRVDGSLVRLSTTEFELLTYLMRHRGRVLDREQILRSVWGIEHDPGTNLVDVYIGYLRRKLFRDGRSSPIVTVRSVGYRFDGDP